MSTERKESLQQCEERFDAIPCTSDHVWPAGLRGEPTGNCTKCGTPIHEYNYRLMASLSNSYQKESRDADCESVTNIATSQWERIRIPRTVRGGFVSTVASDS